MQQPALTPLSPLAPLAGLRGAVLGCLLFLALGSCGGAAKSILVSLKVQAGAEPFQGVVTVRLIASGPPPMAPITAEAPYHSGGTLLLPSLSLGQMRVIRVEGLDGDGTVIARGESEPFEVTEEEPERVIITFARCGLQLFRDGDGDGRGDSSRSKTACAGQPGYVLEGGDCDDADPAVKPGQDGFFASPSAGTHLFDYNCDGREEPELSAVVACVRAPPDCTGQGWQGSVPACGQTGTFLDCVKKGEVCEESGGETKVQSCR